MIKAMFGLKSSRPKQLLALVCCSAVALSACGAPEEHARPKSLSTTIKAVHPWDNTSFTQGLEAEKNGSLIVGTGITNESRIYRTTLNGKQKDNHPLPANYFGEGLAIHGDSVWQLTWKDGVAMRRSLKDLRQVDTASYDREGWGLCSDGDRLVMSDGSGTLTFRDPETFEQTGSVEVTRDGKSTKMLNELDCAADGSVWANVWKSNVIYRIDPDSGKVLETADTFGVFPAAIVPGADVLNGIASVPGSDPEERRFYVTGKYWNELYEVQFQPQ